ncbi:glycosyltransferase family 1 protein [Sporormia fimetaria CBS 119925]|uniref:sterol 3beta-glucosyltransferase n=1 Tax=Sporormia fimetaria CBS 119925 TaxID=1340428 RepID=A0A6A6V1K4_9PLEO|nr:glycosyltransferase family 1 protein [Sporormia fimetaria CBS 119925]
MASERSPGPRLGHKLSKKRRPSRRVSLDIPERFRDMADADEDVTAPKNKDAIPMNQSFFSLIARAGQPSHTELGTMHEAESGESDGEDRRRGPYSRLGRSTRLNRISTSSDPRDPIDNLDGGRGSSQHRRALSQHKLLRSLPKLKGSSRRASRTDTQTAVDMSSSQFLQKPTRPEPPRADADRPLRTPSPSVSRGTDRAESSRAPERRTRRTSTPITTPPTLAERLQQIFGFDDVEEVIADYPCWLLQSLLLQGYMYITQQHICFFAYLPKKHSSKTGYLSKRGQTKYNRYWFVLKDDVLSYCEDPQEKYKPRGLIRLEDAVSATIIDFKDKDEETGFVITMDDKTYRFKADSAASAKEWVRAIQKVIFRTRNEGNSVKILLPIQNVLEVEQSTIMDTADTLKLRVIDNDETYAIDEYFFSFFHHGKDALNVLRIMVHDNEYHQSRALEGPRSAKTPTPASAGGPAGSARDTPLETPQIRENVRATLSPLPAPHLGRTSLSDSQRSSLDANRSSHDLQPRMDATRSSHRPSYEARRSFSRSPRRQERPLHGRVRDKSPLATNHQEASGSPTQSSGEGTESSVAIQSIDDSNVSASQILNHSDVFRTPPAPGSQGMGQEGRESHDLAREPGNSWANAPVDSRHPPFTQSDGSGNEGASGANQLADEHTRQANISSSTSSSALHHLASYPLQKASGLAGFIRTRSKRVSGLFASESMGYYEKVSGMWAGGRKHYNKSPHLDPDENAHGVEKEEDVAKAAEHFREHFAFPETEQLHSSFFASFYRVLPNYGKIYLSDHHFCFRSLMPTSKTKIILPFRDIETVNKEKGWRFGYHGLAVLIRGHEDIFFEFSKAEYRDECANLIHTVLESINYIKEEESPSEVDSDDGVAEAEHQLLQDARSDLEAPDPSEELARLALEDRDQIPLIFDDPSASIIDFKPEPLNIVCLTIGSRGDVQPYIALCKELLKEGHKPKIATHAEFESWVRKHGIDFAPVDGNPAELMKICIDNGMFTVNFMLEANSKMRGWLDRVCKTAWTACQGADLLIESPSAMAGIHIAEALEIPYFRAFTMPWTRTRAYPHAFSVTSAKLGGQYNSITYTAFETVFWAAITSQINRWRRDQLGLPSTSMSKMQTNKRPFLYNFSPSVVTPPLDWPDWIRVTGYWFLDEGDNYQPPDDLVQFIDKARSDGKKLVYVGFGSIVIDDPALLTKTIIDAVQKADVRCVLSKGWSDRLQSDNAAKAEVPLPDEIFQIQAAPHDWLFKQMDAAVHHGGSGTTGASLRAGIPTIIKPFFGDQFFFATRVQDLGVGVYLRKINVSVLGRAMWTATNDERMILKARYLGQKIRRENGTEVAVQTIYRELERAKSLVKKHTKGEHDSSTDDADFEDWTMVEEDEIPQMDKHMAESLVMHDAVAGMTQAPTGAEHMGSSSLAVAGMVAKANADLDAAQKGDL